MSERRGESQPADTGEAGGPTVIDVTPTPGGEPEQPPHAHPRDRLWAALSALAILVLMLATSPYWAPPVASVLPWGGAREAKPARADTAALDARLSALEARVAELAQAQQRLGALEPRVAHLEQHPASAPDPQGAQALSSLGERLGAIEQRIAALAAVEGSQTAADATKAVQAEVQALAQKLDAQSELLAKLQSLESSGAGRTDAALVVAVGQMRSALATSRPYAAELQVAEALAKDQPDTGAELHKLDGRAQQGVPTLAMLTERFAAVAKGAAQSSAPAPADQGWRARAMATLKSLVTIRRVGESRGNDSQSDSASADAAAALRNGDLAAAVAAMRRSGASESPAAASWLEDAQARLDAEAVLTAVDAILVKRFLAAPGAGAKP